MFNKLKRKIIQEVIDELRDLCVEWDCKIEVQKELGEDITFETGIGSGLRKAIRKACEIRDRYR